jgi:hypothetical protein
VDCQDFIGFFGQMWVFEVAKEGFDGRIYDDGERRAPRVTAQSMRPSLIGGATPLAREALTPTKAK